MNTWIELSKSALGKNIDSIRSVVGDAVIAPVIKSNAYGHGLQEILQMLLDVGVEWVCVSSVLEAKMVREIDSNVNILIIGPVSRNDLDDIVETEARVYLTSFHILDVLIQTDKKIKVHINIDTGMGRQGVFPHEVKSLLQVVENSINIELEGVSTHFSSANQNTVEIQSKIFAKLMEDFPSVKYIGIAKSDILFSYPDTVYNFVRPGLSIYGYRKDKVMSPVLSLKTKILDIRDFEAGHCIGYECIDTTKKFTKTALLPVGYGSGINAAYIKGGKALVGNMFAPIIGRVSMDITTIDITGIPEVNIGDTVTLLGKVGNNKLYADTHAKILGNSAIVYEILTRLSANIPRVIVE